MRSLFILLLLNTSLSFGQKTDGWGYLKEGWFITSTLHESNTKSITPAFIKQLTDSLSVVGLKPGADSAVFIANYSFHFSPSPNILLYKSADSFTTLYVEQITDKSALTDRWTSFRKWKGYYGGIETTLWAYYYLKFDSLFQVSLNATFRTNEYFINIQKKLPFFPRNGNSFTDDQWRQIGETNTCLLGIIHILCNQLIVAKDKIYLPSNGMVYHRVFTAAERLAGFVNFWTEVKYNFAFFDQVPELDWDQTLTDYLPRIQADQSNADYYKLMQELCATLKDGHTNVYPPLDLKSETYSPKVELGNFDDRIYVLNTSEMYRNILPLGSEIVKVNGEATADYMKNNLFPYISASTKHIKQKFAVQGLLEIPKGKNMKIEFVNPGGAHKNYTFSDEPDTSSWIVNDPEQFPFEFKMLGDNTAFLRINTFEKAEVVNEFLKVADSIRGARKLIIDLRDNTGGNSNYGYEILKYFSPRPFLTSKWMTREHKAAYKAWAAYIADPPADDFQKECALIAQGKFWYGEQPDSIIPYADQYIAVPIVILIGNNTASAAEDFLVAADNIGLTETVGDLTFGSTGEPLYLRLPGGGSARICTKKDTYPDGREFVGYGIKPKYTVKPALQDVLKHKDKVLEFALTLKP